MSTANYAAESEAAIHEVRADGNKNSEAAIGNPLAVPSGRVDLTDLDEEKRLGGSAGAPSEPTSNEEIGVEYPTEDERNTLRRIPEAIPIMAFWVAFCELAERFSYYGATQVFQSFIQYPRPDFANGGRTGANTDPEGNTGALGLGQRAATGITTFNSFWVYVTPLIGAYLADAHWGRFKTISIAVAIATIGHIILVIAAIPSVMDSPHGSLAAFVIAVIVMGIGTGFFKSNVSPLIAEQIANKKQVIRTTKQGERVILDPALTTARLFMYFYAAINIGAIIGQIGMSYSAKYVGFWLAYALPTFVFLLCVPVLYFGRNRYIRQPPAGSVLANALRLWRFAARGRFSWNPVQWWRNMNAPDFWTAALPSKFSIEERPTWMTWDDAWVLEVRRGLKACQVFVLFPLYWLCYNQINNNLISQASSMKRNGVPTEIVSNLDPLAILILIPILDLVVYPFMRRIGINFTPLKRICAGFFTASFSMVAAAVTQYYIYKKSPCGNYATTDCEDPAPLSVWIQSPAYILIALSEIFASVTGLEYAFTKAPKNMKSLVMSVYLFTTAIANAIGEALVVLAEDPLLIWNYGVFAVVSFIGGCFFWLWFHKLDKEEDELNNMQDSKYEDGAGTSLDAVMAGEKQ